MWLREALRRLALLGATALLAGFLGGVLVLLAPGFGADERELDPRLSRESVENLRERRASQRDLLGFYVRYLGGMARGDFGVSDSLERPVSELLAERSALTLDLVAYGLAGGWLLGLGLALPAALWRNPAYNLASGVLSGLFLCLPAGVLALLLFLVGGPARLALALVIFPRVFRYARNLALESATLPHVLIARAKGLGNWRILLFHVLPWAAPQLAALAGVSVSIAIGAAIPTEVLCDLPGLGQLAWKAAMARDLPVLITMTVLIAALTLAANSVSDYAVAVWGERRR